MQQLSVKLALREALGGLDDGATGIIAAVDTAEALLGLASFRGASARLIGLSWDAEALRVDIGAETARDATGAYVGAFRLAREMTLIAAAAAGVAAIDTAFRCRRAIAAPRWPKRTLRGGLGFAAKLVISPAQAAIVNQVFAAGGEFDR